MVMAIHYINYENSGSFVRSLIDSHLLVDKKKKVTFPHKFPNFLAKQYSQIQAHSLYCFEAYYYF